MYAAAKYQKNSIGNKMVVNVIDFDRLPDHNYTQQTQKRVQKFVT